MKLLRNTLIMTLMILVLGICWAQSLPPDTEPGTVTVYSADGRILSLRAEDAAQYLADGWSEDIRQVVCEVWNTAGTARTVPKLLAAGLSSGGWYTDKTAVTARMRNGAEEKEVFLDRVPDYEEKGWKKVTAPAASAVPADASVKAVALTFDDGPNPETTERLLSLLTDNGVKATFFLLGNRIAGNAGLVKRLSDAGMELGSHTYDHSQLNKLTQEQVRDQVAKTNRALKDACGREATVLRPPYGAYNQTVKDCAAAPLVLWSVDTLDWKSRNPSSIYQEVMAHTGDGDILLFHDIYGTTIDAIVKIIPALKEKGYQLVTVSELAALKGKAMQNGSVYSEF